MDREIKRLLKLSSIPNFKLTEHEQAVLNEWKRRQEPVEIKAKRTYTRKKKTTNEVKEEDKETGELEVARSDES